MVTLGSRGWGVSEIIDSPAPSLSAPSISMPDVEPNQRASSAAGAPILRYSPLPPPPRLFPSLGCTSSALADFRLTRMSLALQQPTRASASEGVNPAIGHGGW